MPIALKTKITPYTDDTIFYSSGAKNCVAVKNLHTQIDLANSCFRQ